VFRLVEWQPLVAQFSVVGALRPWQIAQLGPLRCRTATLDEWQPTLTQVPVGAVWDVSADAWRAGTLARGWHSLQMIVVALGVWHAEHDRAFNWWIAATFPVLWHVGV
jgi:hypothetical protein